MISNKINLSVYISSLFLIISGGCYGQSLKSYNGSFANGSNQTGQATYNYYEDSETKEYIKQGAFSYSLVGKDDNKGLKHTISGNYEKGLKHGVWTYKVVMNDYFMGYNHGTGYITLTANYKNGLADGSWKYSSKTKTRLYSRYTGWGPYNPENIVNTSMNFRKGRIVGNVTINEVGVLKVNGNYDQNSFSTGTWKMNFLDKNQTFEITFKDKFMTDFIGRNGSGQILDGSTSLNPELNAERNQRYLDLKGASLEELENAGYDLDTVCHNSVPTKYIQDYFKYMMNKDWFLYKYITGDLTFERYKKYFPNSIPGGCNIVIEKVNFSTFDNNRDYENAEKAFNSKRYFDAVYSYYDVKKQLNSSNYRYKKSDLKRLDEKFMVSKEKADSLSKVLLNVDDFVSLKKDAIAQTLKAINDIKSSLESENMDFYGIYEKVAPKNLNQIIPEFNETWRLNWFYNSGILKYENSIADPKLQTTSQDISHDAMKRNRVYYNPKSFNENDRESRSSGTEYFYYNTKNSFNKGFQDVLDRLSKENNELLSVSQQFESKTKQIEELNLTTKTKLLYLTYSEVMNSFKTICNEESSFNEPRYMKDIKEYTELLTVVNESLDKIIAHYNGDPKIMDKALKKDADLKSRYKLLFPLFEIKVDYNNNIDLINYFEWYKRMKM